MKKNILLLLPLLLWMGLAKSQLRRATTKEPATTNTLSIRQPRGTGSDSVFDVRSVKMCVDVTYSTGSLPPKKQVQFPANIKINSDGTIVTSGSTRQPLTSQTDKMWAIGETVTVFLSPQNSTAFVRSKVQEYARKWEQFANIHLQFINDFNAANIKVSFEPDNQSWSWVGRDVLFNPLRLYTMNFGWLTNQTEEAEFRRVIEHEFGHALGFIHEHQSPTANISWDKENVYAFFALPPNNWSRSKVDNNIFARYSRTVTNFSAYDPYSIMHYYFPPEFTTNHVDFPWNDDFSPTDRQYAGIFYPYPPTPANSVGTLHTNDDCDLIDFKVEYGVVPADKVEFILELGQNNNKVVTWWKQVVIPTSNNTGSALWVQDNTRRATVQLPVNSLDLNRSMRFWKAKFLGTHTQLDYQWNVLPALRGGCRVRLTWKQDSCN